ncbi:hypothetical protein P7K49_039554 [Saguinus oedipus]|uniref:Uncharacterized protein n=1 Tax=Saguinus oedipus TaxID=9490 RepID=A0ABQ9TBI6_SAGOE|nr:hypothetical protein P7K49_039554 [Saguinus oedipus]
MNYPEKSNGACNWPALLWERDGGQPQGREKRQTHMERTQQGEVVATTLGGRSRDRTHRQMKAHPHWCFSATPSWVRGDPHPGQPQGVGTLSQRTGGKAQGPQLVAQSRAGWASQVTGRPEAPLTHLDTQLLQQRVAREQSVSNNLVAQNANSEGQGVESLATSLTQKCMTHTSVPKKAAITARHGSSRAVWSTPRHRSSSRARDALWDTSATQRPACASRERLFQPSPHTRGAHKRLKALRDHSDYKCGFGRKVSQQRDSGWEQHPERMVQDGHRLPMGTWKRNSVGVSGGHGLHRPMTAPGKGIPGYPRHARRVAVGHGSSLWSYRMLVNQPRHPSHRSQA